MPKITVTIACGTSAFNEAPALEIARILRNLADTFIDEPDAKILQPHDRPLLDGAGLAVGRLRVSQVRG